MLYDECNNNAKCHRKFVEPSRGLWSRYEFIRSQGSPVIVGRSRARSLCEPYSKLIDSKSTLFHSSNALQKYPSDEVSSSCRAMISQFYWFSPCHSITQYYPFDCCINIILFHSFSFHRLPKWCLCLRVINIFMNTKNVHCGEATAFEAGNHNKENASAELSTAKSHIVKKWMALNASFEHLKVRLLIIII